MAGNNVVEFKVTGFDHLAAQLREIPRAMRVRVLRNALAAGARLVRDEARRQAPILQLRNARPGRKPGTVRRAISVRTSKADRKAGDVGVFVNVRPAPGAKFRKGVKVRASQRGANNQNDPYYWRWLEFGSRKLRATPFLRAGSRRLPQALEVFKQQLGRWLDKIKTTGKVTP